MSQQHFPENFNFHKFWLCKILGNFLKFSEISENFRKFPKGRALKEMEISQAQKISGKFTTLIATMMSYLQATKNYLIVNFNKFQETAADK